jgi:hypothetical protein
MSDQDYRRETAAVGQAAPDTAPPVTEFGSNSANADAAKDEKAKQSVNNAYRAFMSKSSAYDDDECSLSDLLNEAGMVKAAAKDEQPHRLSAEARTSVIGKLDATISELIDLRKTFDGPFDTADKASTQAAIQEVSDEREYWASLN